MLQVLDATTQPLAQVLAQFRGAAAQPTPEQEAAVRTIIERVRTEGDRALLELTRQYDCPTLEQLEVHSSEIEAAYEQLDEHTLHAIQHAAERVRQYHQHQPRPASWWMTDLAGGMLGQRVRPLQRVGLYVPGGRALYPSTVIMTAAPAAVAGVEEIILCTPPQADGTLHPAVLVAAAETGVSRIFKIGGAQAIAAMAFGTETVPPVEKIVGPGNVYVNLAKRLLWGIVGVDMWAGASEAVVITEAGTPPEVVAAELLTQLEHGAESVAYLLTPSSWLIQETIAAIGQQLPIRARRAILEQSLRGSYAIHTKTIHQAIQIANAIAPEHLTLMVKHPLKWLPWIENAGCVLVGTATPQAIADYLAGPSHTLPTGGAARFESPISVETFLKRSSVVWLTEDGLATLAPDAVQLAHTEGFDGHAYAIQVRTSQPRSHQGD